MFRLRAGAARSLLLRLLREEPSALRRPALMECQRGRAMYSSGALLARSTVASTGANSDHFPYASLLALMGLFAGGGPALMKSDKEGPESVDSRAEGSADGWGASAGKERLTLREARDHLREGLKPFREKLACKGVVCPAIDLREEPRPAAAAAGVGSSPGARGDSATDQGGEGGGGGRGYETTHSASFNLPRSVNVVKVLSAIVSARSLSNQVMDVHSARTAGEEAAVSFSDQDGSGSMLIRQGPSGPLGSGPSVHVYRDGGFTKDDLEVVVKGYQEAWSGAWAKDDFYRFVIAPSQQSAPSQAQQVPPKLGQHAAPMGPSGQVTAGTGDAVSGLARLRQLGVEVHERGSRAALGWDSLAGYEGVKREIEDTVVMPLQHPEAFDKIARQTRSRFESNRPRAVLFEGPPGTGKTLSARIIASRSNQPMVHIPVETIMSKWYGESEKKLSAIFDACDQLGGAIIFIDEVDALATSRDSGNMHEATRRVLSVILQKLEGFEGGTKSTLICATNRKRDLDSALISRFQLSIRFNLPDTSTRSGVFNLYAKHLSEKDLSYLAAASGGMSCRDIKETCEHAERRWASKIIREQETGSLPPIQEYVQCLEERGKQGPRHSRPAEA